MSGSIPQRANCVNLRTITSTDSTRDGHRMKFLVACQDNGGFKQIDCVARTDTSRKDAPQPRRITQFFGDVSKRNHILQFAVIQDTFIVALRRQLLCIYDLLSDEYELLREIPLLQAPVCFRDLGDALEAVVVVLKHLALIVSLDPDHDPIEVKLTDNEISDLAVNPETPGVWAYGGKDFDITVAQLWDSDDDFTKKLDKKLFSVDVKYTAKNSPPNHLDISPKIWPRRIRFLPGDFRLVVGTHYGELRVYDFTKDLKPLHHWKVCDKPIITLTVVDDGDAVIITNAQLLVAKYLLTKIDPRGWREHLALAGDIFHPLCRLLGKYLEGGNTGAVFGVAVFDDVLATGGLDRYLRVFRATTRSLLAKVYVGLEVLDVIVLDGDDKLQEIEDERYEEKQKRQRENDDEAEQIWEELEEASKKRRK